MATLVIFRDLQDYDVFILAVVRLGLAGLLGAILGYERQIEGKSAGMRTHMLVALGAALFAFAPLHGDIQSPELARVIQGIAAGIGFLGAGTILKAENPLKVQGLTTAASIWLTAAVGLTIGAGFLWPALLAVAFGWIILEVVGRLEYRFRKLFGHLPRDEQGQLPVRQPEQRP
ncbi:MAG: MgtC/SapB family protein [Planctomycetes bacterium]|nr:MgtC/SapB family protein [Planctomycetota bacterium]